MKRQLLLLIIFFYFPACSIYGKDKAGKHSDLISVNVSYLRFINTRDVQIQQGRQHFMTANNTNGYQVGISYEYTNRYHITFTPTIAYGQQPTELNWMFYFQNFDPSGSFANDFHTTHVYEHRVPYLSNSFLIGYNIHLPGTSNTLFQVKGGIGAISRFYWNNQTLAHIIAYRNSNTPNTLYVKEYAYTDIQSGNSGKWYNERSPFYTFYIGLTKTIAGKNIRAIKLGLVYTHAIIRNGKESFNLSRSFYYNASGEITGVELYNNKFRSIGICASLCF